MSNVASSMSADSSTVSMKQLQPAQRHMPPGTGSLIKDCADTTVVSRSRMPNEIAKDTVIMQSPLSILYIVMIEYESKSRFAPMFNHTMLETQQYGCAHLSYSGKSNASAPAPVMKSESAQPKRSAYKVREPKSAVPRYFRKIMSVRERAIVTSAAICV
jgi:hypothetical protein